MTDEQLIDEAMREVEAKNRKFFEYFGLRDYELEYAKQECEQFIKDFAEAKMGRGFFDSPLARKAFMVGFYRGRNTMRPIEFECNFEKQNNKRTSAESEK